MCVSSRYDHFLVYIKFHLPVFYTVTVQIFQSYDTDYVSHLQIDIYFISNYIMIYNSIFICRMKWIYSTVLQN